MARIGRGYMLLVVSLLSVLATANAQVPTEWTVAKAQLTDELHSIAAAADARWDGQPYCTGFSGNVLLANSNRGYRLWTQAPPAEPNPLYQAALYAKIDTMLMAYRQLGYSAVDITIQYPLLVESFPNSRYYLDFYRHVYQLARQRGMKIMEGCEAAFVDTVFGEPYMARDVRNYYFDPDGNPQTDDALDAERYKRDKLQMLQTIIDSLKPDYLTVENEPETQKTNMFGLVDFSPESVHDYVRYVVDNLEPGDVLLGAGAGSWNDIEYFDGVARTDIDFIDYHIYPVGASSVDDMAFRIDSIADRYSKKVVVGECWVYKATNAELLNADDPIALASTIYARDVFDYWSDVDSLFFRMMTRLSRQSKIDIVSFFWSPYLFGQLTYDPAIHGAMSNAEILQAGQQAAFEGVFALRPTSTGRYVQKLVAEICDISSGVEKSSSAHELSIYPNPTSGGFTIDPGDGVHGPVSVTITDMLGREMSSSSVASDVRTYVTVGTLSPGVYLVRVAMPGGAFVRALVVR